MTSNVQIKIGANASQALGAFAQVKAQALSLKRILIGGGALTVGGLFGMQGAMAIRKMIMPVFEGFNEAIEQSEFRKTLAEVEQKQRKFGARLARQVTPWLDTLFDAIGSALQWHADNYGGNNWESSMRAFRGSGIGKSPSLLTRLLGIPGAMEQISQARRRRNARGSDPFGPVTDAEREEFNERYYLSGGQQARQKMVEERRKKEADLAEKRAELFRKRLEENNPFVMSPETARNTSRGFLTAGDARLADKQLSYAKRTATAVETIAEFSSRYLPELATSGAW